MKRNWKGELASIGRQSAANLIKKHRRHHYTHEKYSKNRGIKEIRKEFGLELNVVVRNLLKEVKGPKILDSGAGYLKMSADLKKRFGNKISVSALTIANPNMSDKTIEAARERMLRQGIEEKKARKQVEEMRAASKNARVVDEILIQRAERLKSENKFHLIIDIYGPVLHGQTNRVLENYLKALVPGGKLITPSVGDPLIEEFFSKRHASGHGGYYFKIREINPAVFELVKVKA